MKGIGLSGAYREMTDRGYTPECVAGTSAGAINAALVACGFTGPEIEEVALHRMKFPLFEDKSFLDRFGKTGDAAEFFRTRGMHSGDYFLEWMRELLKEKGVTKFGELRDPNAKTEARTYRLQVIASDLSARSMLILPRDADKSGYEPDEPELAPAGRRGSGAVGGQARRRSGSRRQVGLHGRPLGLEGVRMRQGPPPGLHGRRPGE